MKKNNLQNTSFRDPDGSMFHYKNKFYRFINISYKKNYDFLIKSKLYKKLVTENKLISHNEIDIQKSKIFKSKSFDKIKLNKVYKMIEPQKILFISYPYEWSFNQLKDAALLTLDIQKKALNCNMSLKDSSAYNIQFLHGKPIFIDTLSFEKYKQDKPWIAYKQFCEHFLAPLALTSYKNINFAKLLTIYNNGIPLEVASSLLPIKSKFNLSILTHIHLHAKSQVFYANKNHKLQTVKEKHFSKNAMLQLILNLENTINNLKYNNKSFWKNYYKDTHSLKYINHKKELVSSFIELTNSKTACDLGANTGMFTKLCTNKNIKTIAIDNDAVCIDKIYLDSKSSDNKNLLPIVCNLTNPTPGTGWINLEHFSIIERCNSDLVLALSIVHHLAISNNIPLLHIRDLFYKICKYLIIEFVPKSDYRVQKMLSFRKDIFNEYTQNNFEKIFKQKFKIIKFKKVKDSKRIVYLMEKR